MAQSESLRHDAAYAAAVALFELQKQSGKLAFGQIYCAVKNALVAYEVRAERLAVRIKPSQN